MSLDNTRLKGLAFAAALLCAGGAAVSALAAGSGGGELHAAPPGRSELHTWKPPQYRANGLSGAQTLATLTHRFGALARARGASDTLPQYAAETVGADFALPFGANPALSRRVLVRSGTVMYVVPGRGFVCLVTQAGVGSCVSAADAVAGKFFVLEQGQGVPRGDTRLYGFVPNGVRTVSLSTVHGPTVHVQVRDNAWLLETHRLPASIRWNNLGRSIVIRIPRASVQM